MTCLKNFLNKPVLLQIGDPIAAAHSSEEVALADDEPITCGRAVMTMSEQPVLDGEGRPVQNRATGAPLTRRQPLIVQILRGDIVSLSEDGLMFSTVGGDGLTPVIIYIPMSNVRAVTFAVDHVAAPEEPQSKIISPN